MGCKSFFYNIQFSKISFPWATPRCAHPVTFHTVGNRIYFLDLSYLCINLPLEAHGIGQVGIAACRPSGSYGYRTVIQDPPQDRLFNLQPLAFCQYQIEYPAADYPGFKDYTLVRDSVHGTRLYHDTLNKRHHPYKQQEYPSVMKHFYFHSAQPPARQKE